jgi:hypothetical protein
MRGRKKTQNPKSEHIRITFRTRAGLLELSRILKMPPYYKEGDIIEALMPNEVATGKSQFLSRLIYYIKRK